MTVQNVLIERRVQKWLAKADKPVRVRLVDGIQGLVEEPMPEKSEQLTSFAPLRKFRVGDYRIVYRYDAGADLLVIFLIEHRSRVYDDLVRIADKQ